MKIRNLFLPVLLFICTSGFSQGFLDKQIVLFDFDNNINDQFGKTKSLNADVVEYSPSRKGGNTKSLSILKEKASFEIADTTVLNLKYYPTISISFWLRATGKGNIALFSNDSTINNGGWSLTINNNGNLCLQICPTPKSKQVVSLISKQPVALNKWKHYTLTFDKKNSIGLYVNGEKDTIIALKKSLSLDAISKLTIGGKSIKANSNLEIDDLRFFGECLSSDDIKKVYKLGFNSSQIEFDLGRPNNAKNSCTLQFELTPDGEKVLIENKGSKNTEGFVFKFYDKKLNVITEVPGNQKNYDFNYSTFNNQPVFFLAVVDPNGFVVQIYQIHLTY